MTELLSTRADSGRVQAGVIERVSWYPLAVLMAAMMVDHADRILLSALFPAIKAEFGLSDAALGTLQAGFIVISTAAAVPLGMVVDRTVRVRMIAWTTAGWSWAMILTGTAGSYATLLGSRMFLGIAEAGYVPAGFSLLSDYYPVRERGRVMGLFRAAGILAWVTIPIGGAIADAWGWRAAFFAYAIPGFLLALIIHRLPEPGRGHQDRAYHGVTEPAGSAGSEGSELAAMSLKSAFAAILRVRTVLVLLLGEFISTFFAAGLSIWWTTFLVRYHGMSLTEATSWTALFGVCGVIGVIGGGYLGDRLLSKGMPAGRLHVAVAAKLIAMVLLFPALAVDETWLFIVLMMPATLFLTAPSAPVNALLADVVHPDLRGRLASMNTITRAIGGASAPLLFGLASDAIGLRQAELALLPLLGVGAVVIWIFGGRYLSRDLSRMKRVLGGSEP